MRYSQPAALLPLVVVLALAAPALALTKMGELSEYYIDYADVKQGATISSPCKAQPDASNLESLIGSASRGAFIFADGVEQREEFTIDLGQERKVGMFIFRMGRGRADGDGAKRTPNSLTAQISTVSANGPWTQVYKLDPANVTESFALEDVPARWVRFDLGVNTDGVGSRVGRLSIYKRYQLKSGPELMEEFCTQFRRDADGLQEFWKAVDAGNWEDACDRIIEHFAKWPAEPKGEASPRVQPWMENTVEDGGLIYKFDSPDWDWLRDKPGGYQHLLGGLPGASSILHGLKNAYTATGDEAYAKQLSLLLRDWLQDLPCPGVHRGQNGSIVNGWAGIVASQRTWSFGTMVHAMFKENKYFDRDLKINLLYSFWEHCNFMQQICPELGGNWLTNANSCLFNGAKDFPEFVQQKEWLAGSIAQFETSLTRDFLPSGKASEDSTMYTPISANQLTGQYDDIREAGLTINAEAQRRMAGLWDLETWVHYPDQSVPAIGDAHRASPLAKPVDLVPENYLRWFDRPDLVYVNTQGREGKMPEQSSHSAPDFGWYVMRSPWDTKPCTDARQLFFKASKAQGHGHPDQLEVMVYAYGREIITDPGQPAYGQVIERQVRPTAAHSTICVDGRDQGRAPGTQHAWVVAKGVDFVDAECLPYEGLTHRRQIVFLKSGRGAPDYWLVRDAVTGDGEHTYDLNYHFSQGADPVVSDSSVCTTYPSGGNALMRCPDQSVKPEIVDGYIGLLSELAPSKICRFSRQGAAPARFVTLILPFDGPKAPKSSVQYVKPDPKCAGADAVCVRVNSGFGSDFIVISSTPGTALSFGGGKIRTDASVVVIRTDSKGRTVHAFKDSGSAIYSGKRI